MQRDSITIPLSQGMFVVIDADDLPLVEGYAWVAARRRHVWYAIANVRQPHGGSTAVLMHRLILDAPKGMQVDHKDGDGLNNRRSNIRLCTPSQNQQNRVRREPNATGYFGIYYIPKARRWVANIKHQRKRIYIGCFSTPEAAAIAYDERARELFGEFGRFNFPKDHEQQAVRKESC